MKRIVCLFIFMILSTIVNLQVQGATISKDKLICKTWSHFDELNSYIEAKDYDGINYLLSKGICVITRYSMKTSIIKQYEKQGISHVRVYLTKNDAITGWVYTSFIEK